MKGLVFYAGCIVLAHALYVALSAKENLQAWHHGHSYVPALSLGGVSLPTSAVILVIIVETVVGVLTAMFGAVGRAELQPARLSETTKYDRYDRSMFTGVGFTHFNHRGRLAGKGLEPAAKDAAGKK